MKESTRAKLYELTIVLEGGEEYSLCGTYASLSGPYEAWRDSTFDEESKMTIKGIEDNLRRTPIELTVVTALVHAMSLAEL